MCNNVLEARTRAKNKTLCKVEEIKEISKNLCADKFPKADQVKYLGEITLSRNLKRMR